MPPRHDCVVDGQQAGTGLLVAQLGDLPAWLGRAVWFAGGLGVTASLPGLATVGVRWLVRRHHHVGVLKFLGLAGVG
jgi:hypothetical protein